MAETTTKATPKKAATKAVAAGAKPAATAKLESAPVSATKPVKAKPATAPKALAPKATAAKKTAAKTAAKAPSKAMVVTDEQRYRMVAEAAYYRAESNQFKSDPLRDWIDAEQDIATLLSGKK